MLKGLWRYSADEVDLIRTWAARGRSGVAIAKRLNRTPQSVRVKAVEYDISLRQPSTEHRRVLLPLQLWRDLVVAAREAHETPARYAALILGAVIKRRLFHILEYDAAPAPAPAPAGAMLASLQPQLTGRMVHQELRTTTR
jgi:hypothetical protein